MQTLSEGQPVYSRSRPWLRNLVLVYGPYSGNRWAVQVNGGLSWEFEGKDLMLKPVRKINSTQRGT